MSKKGICYHSKFLFLIFFLLCADKGHVGSLVCEQDQDCLDSGKSEFLFKPMDVKAQILSVACGKEHALLLSSTGNVYSLGGGRYVLHFDQPLIMVSDIDD